MREKKNSVSTNKIKHQTITYNGDVKSLVDDYRKLQRKYKNLKIENNHLKKDLEDTSRYTRNVSVSAFTKYMKIENPDYYKALKNKERKNTDKKLLAIFDEKNSSKEEDLFFEMFKVKEKKFLNILDDVMDNRYKNMGR